MFKDTAANSVPVALDDRDTARRRDQWATAAISFLQGPPAVTYWVDIVKDWLHRKRDEGVGEITVKRPGGTARFTVTPETDLAELAGALHKAMFPKQSQAPRDFDDLAI